MSDTTIQTSLFSVIHPLDDVHEQKLFRADLGRIRMSRSVRFALFLLRGYLASMVLLVGWRVLTGM